MSEMARSEGGMDRVPIFYKIIDNHDLISLSFRMNLEDFDRAHDRVVRLASQWQMNIDFGPWTNKFFFGYHGLIDGFHLNRENAQRIIPLDETVDFIFDEQSEEALLPPWNEYLSLRPEGIRKFYGAKPRFENDQNFLPLQAADLWAWWVREWYEEDSIELPDKMREFDFGKWQGKKRPSMALSMSEDQIFERLQELMFEATPHATKRDFYGPGLV